MEQNKEFLEKALKLFYLNGAKTTTMDDIAKEFSMSKKTLYQQYANKEVLLDAVLNFELQQVIEELSNISHENACPIDRMLCRDEKMKKMMENDNSLFIRQMKKYYHSLYEKQVVRMSVEVFKVFKINIENGRRLGLYRMDFDAEEYARFLMMIMLSYNDSPIVDFAQISRTDFAHRAIIFYLEAITTEKGKEKLKQILNNDK